MKNLPAIKPVQRRRIHYIVKGNKRGASRFLYDQGYEPPRNSRHLYQAITELIAKDGKPAIQKLIKHHPDAKLILKLHTSLDQKAKEPQKEESFVYMPDFTEADDQYSNFTGQETPEDLLRKLRNSTQEELKKYYETITKKANESPDDKPVSERVQMVWNELRGRGKTENPRGFVLNKESITAMGLCLALGILIGTAIK